MPKNNLRRDFYQIQSEQWKKSLFLFIVLILFYFAAVGLISLAVVWSLGIFLPGRSFWTNPFISRLLLMDSLAAALIAFFHFQDARKFGASFILKRLEAQLPDTADRYHIQFINTLEEICIASGVPTVNAYIIPASAINSIALIEQDGTPAVAVTEGLLAECSRDELQAIAAHEIAHISGGDAFYVTLVCSLANLFERLREAIVPDEPEAQSGAMGRGDRPGGAPPLIYLAVTFSSLVMHLLSMLISRKRELLADAAAVEFSRGPIPLARAIYKAHLKNSFIGDFTVSYSPLFILPPNSKEISDSFFSRLFNSHPPVMKRIEILAAMAGKRPDEIIRQVWEFRQNREKARTVLTSSEEKAAPTGSLRSGPETASGNAEEGKTPASGESPDTPFSQGSRIWFVRGSKDNWEGPLTIEELLSLPLFTMMTPVKNSQEKIEAKAREFPQIRIAIHSSRRRKSLDAGRRNKCPRCGIPLIENFYEGVTLKTCRQCRGKLVDMAFIDRLIARREVAFSADLLRKAMAFKERFLAQPVKTKKISSPPPAGPLICPDCGEPLKARPFNYSYGIPVDKCLSCHKIWFDADELEILQALIENR